MEDIEKKFWEALTAKVDTGLKKFSLSEIHYIFNLKNLDFQNF